MSPSKLIKKYYTYAIGSGVNRKVFGRIDYYTELLMKIHLSRLHIAVKRFGVYPTLLFFVLYPLYTIVTILGFIHGLLLKTNKINISYKEIEIL